MCTRIIIWRSNNPMCVALATPNQDNVTTCSSTFRLLKKIRKYIKLQKSQSETREKTPKMRPLKVYSQRKEIELKQDHCSFVLLRAITKKFQDQKLNQMFLLVMVLFLIYPLLYARGNCLVLHFIQSRAVSCSHLSPRTS